MSSRASSKRRLLAAVLFVAAALPVLYGLKHPAPYNPDGFEAIAAEFARSGSLTDQGAKTAVREPAYPVLLGSFYAVFGHHRATSLLLNGLLAAATACGLYVAGAALFGEAVGLSAAAVSAVYPPLIFYAGEPRRELLAAALAVWSVLALVNAVQKGGGKRFASAGVLGALAALTNTTFLPFGLGTAPVLLLWLGRKRLERAVKFMVIYAAAFVFLYSLWPLRNYKVFHKFVMGSTAAAGTVFYVNQLVPAEVGGLSEERDILMADPAYVQGSAIADPVAHEAFFAKAAMERVKADPLRYAKLVAWRFFWESWRVAPRPRSYGGRSYRLLWWVSVLSDGWIIPLGLLGLLAWRGRPPEAVFIPALIASVNLVYSLIFFILRYRVPVMPWMILLAALTLVKAAKFLLDKELGL